VLFVCFVSALRYRLLVSKKQLVLVVAIVKAKLSYPNAELFGKSFSSLCNDNISKNTSATERGAFGFFCLFGRERSRRVLSQLKKNEAAFRFSQTMS